jgi:hypothetical protein
MAKKTNKKDEGKDKQKEEKGFVPFITKTLSNIISLLIWVLLGSNFMYYANTFDQSQYGGTEIKCPPYNKEGIFEDVKCRYRDGDKRLKNKPQSLVTENPVYFARRATKGGTKKQKDESKLNIFSSDLYEWSFPYKNAMTKNPEYNIVKPPKKKDGGFLETVIDDVTETAGEVANFLTGTGEEEKDSDVKWNPFKWIIYWLTQAIAFSYATGRSLLSKVLPLFKTTTSEGWLNTLGIFGSPFLLGLIFTLLAPIIGFVAALWGFFIYPFSIDGFPFVKTGWRTFGWIIFLIIMLFSGLAFGFASGVTGIQFIQLIIFFVFLPLLNTEGIDYVKERFKNNWILISCLMLILITSNAWTYLGQDWGIGFLVTTLIVISYFIFIRYFQTK